MPNAAAKQGGIMLHGPQTVPVRSGHDSSRTLQFFEHFELFLLAANRDGSRSDPELDAAVAAKLACCYSCLIPSTRHSSGSRFLPPGSDQGALPKLAVTTTPFAKRVRWTAWSGVNHS